MLPGRPLRSKASLTALFVLTSVSMFGQVSTGTITGTVADPSGAAVANVQVSVVQTETNLESRAITNGEGIYRVQTLQPGTYTVTFEATGFKRLVQTGVTLRVGDVLPVNATLQVADLTAAV